MATVKVIPPRTKRPERLRVAAYCRVSSDSADQLHSYATQIRSYTEYISQQDGWELVDIYADEGLTGTRIEQRTEFQRMMAIFRVAGKSGDGLDQDPVDLSLFRLERQRHLIVLQNPVRFGRLVLGGPDRDGDIPFGNLGNQPEVTGNRFADNQDHNAYGDENKRFFIEFHCLQPVQ